MLSLQIMFPCVGLWRSGPPTATGRGHRAVCRLQSTLLVIQIGPITSILLTVAKSRHHKCDVCMHTSVVDHNGDAGNDDVGLARLPRFAGMGSTFPLHDQSAS